MGWVEWKFAKEEGKALGLIGVLGYTSWTGY